MWSEKTPSFIFFIVACLISCVNANAQESRQDSATNAHQLLQIEQVLMDAIATGDTAVWSQYLDKDFFVVTEDGTRFTRAPFLATFHPLPPGFGGNIKVTQPKIVFHDNVAVIAFVSDEHETVYGQQIHTTYGTADTFYKASSGWKLLASEVFEIPQLPTPIHLPSNILQQFTGTYHLTDSISCQVSFERDTLFIQKRNRPPQSLFAETNNVFFLQSDTRGRKIFVADDQGKMMMLERRNGQDVIWKRKIK